MKLYTMQLNSLEALERERLLLKYARKQNNPEDILSFDNIFGDKPSRKKDKNDEHKSLFGGLGQSGVYLDLAVKYLLPLLQKKKNKKTVVEEVAHKSPAVLVTKIGKEVLFGYLKWKALEFSYKWIKKTIQKQKQK